MRGGSATVPFRIFDGDKVALGNIPRSNLDTNYSVNVKDGLNLLQGDLRINTGSKLDIQTGTGQTIETATNTYPSFFFDNGITKYQFGNAKVSSTFNEGDFFIYNSTTAKSNLLITKTGDTIIGKGATSVIGSEGISLQSDTLVKGSDTSASTTGFKVASSVNTSLLEVKNNGVINASNLPTSSAGLSSGDIWNNAGVLNIV